MYTVTKWTDKHEAIKYHQWVEDCVRVVTIQKCAHASYNFMVFFIFPAWSQVLV